jgi:hypothetical protein
MDGDLIRTESNQRQYISLRGTKTSSSLVFSGSGTRMNIVPNIPVVYSQNNN